MADFDLDARVNQNAGTAEPQITSKSLCTPGCNTGALGCFTRNCTITEGCHFTR